MPEVNVAMPEVSVVIPAYNASATLAETLASVSAQTFEDFEVIVVDDGSSDNTASVAADTGDSRIRVMSVPNRGVARARNHGISQGQSTFVAFLDADDLWEHRKLELQVAALHSQPDAGLCVTLAVRIDAQSRDIGTMPLLQTDDVGEALLRHSMIVGCLSSGVVRRTTLDQVGVFDPRFSQCADWDLWLRMSTATRFAVVTEPLVRYRTSPGNMSSNIALLEHETFHVLDSFFATPAAARYDPIRKQVYGIHWMVCAGSYLHRGKPSDALRCGICGLIAYPPSLVRLPGVPWRWAKRIVARSGVAR
jgi:glycosyltransferase involved in cell wall biosynthesis